MVKSLRVQVLLDHCQRSDTVLKFARDLLGQDISEYLTFSSLSQRMGGVQIGSMDQPEAVTIYWPKYTLSTSPENSVTITFSYSRAVAGLGEICCSVPVVLSRYSCPYSIAYMVQVNTFLVLTFRYLNMFYRRPFWRR